MKLQPLQQFATHLANFLNIPYIPVKQAPFKSIDNGSALGCYGQDGIEIDLDLIATLENPVLEAYVTIAHEVVHAYQEHFQQPMDCAAADIFAGLYVLAQAPDEAKYSLMPPEIPEKIIVLDIDGVINTNRTMLACGRTPHAGNYRLHWLDQTGIGLLRRLCLLSGAKILLSSTWGESMTSYELSLFRSTLGLPIVDKIPLAPEARWDRIQAWRALYPQVKEIVIVDDEAFTFPADLLVQTREEDGITLEIAQKIAKKLGVDIYNQTAEEDLTKSSTPTFTIGDCLK